MEIHQKKQYSGRREIHQGFYIVQYQSSVAVSHNSLLSIYQRAFESTTIDAGLLSTIHQRPIFLVRTICAIELNLSLHML